MINMMICLIEFVFILASMRKKYLGSSSSYRKFGLGGRNFRSRDNFNNEDYGDRKFRSRDTFNNEDNGEGRYKKRHQKYFQGDSEDVSY